MHIFQHPPNDQEPLGRQRSNNPGNGDNTNGTSPGKKEPSPLRTFLLIVGMVALLGAGYLFLFGQSSDMSGQPVGEVPYSAFYQQVQAGNVKDATFQGQDITGEFKNALSLTDANGNPVLTTQYHLTQLPNGDPNLVALLNRYHVQYQAKPVAGNNSLLNIFVGFLPLLLVFGLIFFFARRATQSQQNIFSFGKSKAKVVLADRPGTTFADVAGVDEAKYDLVEVVEFLKTPGKFQRLGGKIPRGVLLVGPPGTGKTLLARAVAGEAEVPFFSMSGSEFVEVLVGVGASRVRDLFDQAKKAAPSIIFIDEIDAVGRQRGSNINSNDEREQTLNQLLVEMDGFDTHQAVVVIAATNRPDGLDKALLRPGRFDRRVVVERPDWNGRLAILKIHTRGVPLAKDVDLITIARATPGMVGADLANLVNEAALLAARRDLNAVRQHCFDEALDKILIGAERPLVLSEADLNVVAYHESGHALTGRAAEQVAIGHITTGAENDLQRVTAIARQMVARWGMSERLGTISFSEREDPFGGTVLATGSREYSEQTATIIDEEVKRIVNWAYDRALSLLTSHHETLDGIAHSLRLHETLDAKQLRAILEDTHAVHTGPL